MSFLFQPASYMRGLLRDLSQGSAWTNLEGVKEGRKGGKNSGRNGYYTVMKYIISLKNAMQIHTHTYIYIKLYAYLPKDSIHISTHT